MSLAGLAILATLTGLGCFGDENSKHENVAAENSMRPRINAFARSNLDHGNSVAKRALTEIKRASSITSTLRRKNSLKRPSHPWRISCVHLVVQHVLSFSPFHRSAAFFCFLCLQVLCVPSVTHVKNALRLKRETENYSN